MPKSPMPSPQEIADLRIRERDLVEQLTRRVTEAIDNVLPEARCALFAKGKGDMRRKLTFTVEMNHDEPASVKVGFKVAARRTR